MNTKPLANFWPLMHSVIQGFWAILEPPIEEAALRNNIPFELYTYSEFGAETFSVREFQKRDPFTNPVVFEKVFATLNFKGWIEPLPDDRYGITQKALGAIQRIVQAGEAPLLSFEAASVSRTSAATPFPSSPATTRATCRACTSWARSPAIH